MYARGNKILARQPILTTVLLLIALAAGILLRPPLASLWHGLQGKDRPDPRATSQWQARTQQFRRLDPLSNAPALVYLGDSVTDWIEFTEFLDVPGGAVINRGISGDTSAGLLARARQSVPKGATVYIMLVGYNDLVRGVTAATVATRVATLLEHLLEQPGVQHVVVEGVASRNRALRAPQQELNRRLAEIADQETKVSFLDLPAAFAASSRRNLFLDNVHLTAEGVRLRLELEIDHLHERQLFPGLRLRPVR